MNERTNEKVEVLSWEKIEEKHEEFLRKEPRECAYEIAKECIDKYWMDGEISDENLKKITHAVLTFLFAWNSTFYRGCIFKEDFIMKIKDKINKNKKKLDSFKKKCIYELNPSDKNNIKDLYESFSEVLACKKKVKGNKNSTKTIQSPVSTAKFLHIICPNFFPLWDRAIAERYGCRWGKSEFSFESYWEYMVKVKEQINNIEGTKTDRIKEILKEYTILKLIDEYNYMCYTKGNKQEEW
jgi:hypothetical protein